MKVIYENQHIKVTVNSSDEVFVENKQNKDSTIRIGSYGRGRLQITCHNGTIIPGSVNGLSACFVYPGRIGR